jgi:hypothetical protein
LPEKPRLLSAGISSAGDRGVLTADIAPKGAAVNTRTAGQAVIDALG